MATEDADLPSSLVDHLTSHGDLDDISGVPPSDVDGDDDFGHDLENQAVVVQKQQQQNQLTSDKLLLLDSYMYNNRFDRLMAVMAHHPNYLEPFLRTHNFILKGDGGPLPAPYRHYIAIMAAARHQCTYLVNLQKQEFSLHGGDKSWLTSLSAAPQKLRDLNEINKILAHQPWLFNKSHIERLTRGRSVAGGSIDGVDQRQDTWSVSEVVHAIVLLAHFHSLSSLVFSSGINEDDPVFNDATNTMAAPGSLGTTPPSTGTSPPRGAFGGRAGAAQAAANLNNKRSSPGDLTPPSPPSPPNGGVGGVAGEHNVEALMKKMKSITEQQADTEGVTDEDLVRGFRTCESQSAELGLPILADRTNHQLNQLGGGGGAAIGLGSGNGSVPRIHHKSSPPPAEPLSDELMRFVDDGYEFAYVDFAQRRQSSDLPTFRIQDYSWDDHGFSLVNQLYDNVGNLLDEKFKLAYNLTYYT